LTAGDGRLEYVAPGYLFYERNQTLLAHPFDVRSGKLTGDPFPLADGIGSARSGLAHFSASANGILIYRGGNSQQSTRLVWVDRQGRELGTLGRPALYDAPALSPDEKRIAVDLTDEGGNTDIWVIDIARNIPTRLTFDDADDTAGTWSPDGSRLVFASSRVAAPGLYWKPAGGTGRETSFQPFPATIIPTEWLQGSGKILAFANAGAAGTFNVYGVSEPGGAGRLEPLLAERFIEAQPHLSPDGRFLAYCSNEADNLEVYLTTYPPGGGKWQVSARRVAASHNGAPTGASCSISRPIDA
jgi:dipeptidyl aminopeptidase/acylaminoacyl peptidase